jgi:hypothetical protein
MTAKIGVFNRRIRRGSQGKTCLERSSAALAVRLSDSAKLLVLSKLRGLQKIVVEEAKKVMELSVEELMDIPFVEEAFLKGEKEGEEKGKKEGQAEMLSHMLEGRFGPLPEWAKEKIASAEIETLEKWGLRLLNASNLEEVLAENIN